MVPEPRIIEMAGDSYHEDDSPTIHNPPPITFSICRESRYEAMRSYTQLLFQPWGMTFWGDATTVEIWIDYSRDTLFFGYGTLSTYWKTILSHPNLKQNLRFLAWTCSHWPKHHPTDKALRGLKALEEIRYVCDWDAPDLRNSADIKFIANDKSQPSPRGIAKERELLEEWAEAKQEYPDWLLPMVKASILERGGQSPEICKHNWWCFSHGEILEH